MTSLDYVQVGAKSASTRMSINYHIYASLILYIHTTHHSTHHHFHTVVIIILIYMYYDTILHVVIAN